MRKHHCSFWLSIVLASCTLVCAQPLRAQTPGDEPKIPRIGLRVIEVVPGGPAEHGGVQRMDMLAKYGKFRVIDHSSYYKAREFYLKNPKVKVPLEFWRAGKPFLVHVYPGWVGMNTNEYNPVAYQLDSVINSFEGLENIAEYLRAIEFKDHLDKDRVAAQVAKANEMIEQAQLEGTLTPTQILVFRIRMIADDASVEELKKQEDLLAEFIGNQAPEYIGWLGNQLMNKEHFRPARALLKQYLVYDPGNVSVRLNIGYIGLKLGYWEDAEAGADLVLTAPEKLSKRGLRIAYQQKACGLAHRGDYFEALTYAERGFALEQEGFGILLIQLMAALTGNVEKFKDASGRFKEAVPENDESYSLQRDSAEALLLVMNRQEEAARAIVARWSHKDRAEGRLRHYWREFPASSKVVENWTRLATPQK